MAILGEANIIVKAITTGVEEDLKRAMDKVGKSGANPSKEAGKRVGKAFKEGNAGEAVKASKAWTKLNRTGMVMQGVLGAVIGSVAALGSGLFALAGAMGQAGAAGVALVSTFAQVKVATMVAKSAMKGIGQAVSAADKSHGGLKKTLKEVREEMQQLAFDAEDAALAEKRAAMDLEKAREELMRVQDLPPNSMARREAEQSYEEADLAYRRAKDRNADLQDQINNPPKKKGTGTDPFAKLTASQKVFAKYLVSIKGRMNDLHEAAASGFLPLLQTQIERVMNGGAFDKLVDGYHEVGVGLGRAAKSFVDALESTGAIDNLRDFFRQTAASLPKLGTVLGNVLGSFLGLMKAAEPLTKRFLDWLVKASTRMSDLVKLKSNNGTFARFFRTAGDIAGQLGRTLRNVFGGLGAMFKSATGPGSGGQLLLDWMERASAKFKEAKTSFSGGLLDEQNFKRSAENFKIILQTLNAIIGAFKGAGGDKDVAGFWDAIRTAVPAIKTLVRNSVRTAASFGKVLAAAIRILAVFSDSGQANAFFSILAATAGGLAKVMETLAPYFGWTGAILGAISGFALMATIVSKVALVMKGFAVQAMILGARMRGLTVAQMVATVGFKKMGISAKVAGAATKSAFMANPALLVIMLAIEAAMWAINAAAEEAQRQADQVTKSFENGATAAEAWNNALAGRGEADQATLSFNNLGEAVQALVYYDNPDVTIAEGLGLAEGSAEAGRLTAAMGPLRDELKAYGTALGTMVADNLEGAQKNFKGLASAQGMTRAGQKKLLESMPDYRAALKEQADALGVNIYNTDGSVNSAKQLAFAMGDGEIKLRRAAAAAKDFQQKIADAAAGMLNFNDAVKENTNKAGKIDVKGLIKTLAKQAQDAANYYSNLMRLKAKGVGQPVIDAIIGMGPKEGAAAAAQLAKASQKDLKTLTDQYSNVGKLTSEEMSGKLAEAGPAIQAVMKKLGTTGVDAFVSALISGDSIDGAMTTVLNKMNNSAPKNMRYVFANGQIQLVSQTGHRVVTDAKGGFIKAGMFAKGGVMRAADGMLAGRGGPQADMIPALLSAGEYVMNASSTSKFLPMLHAMNQDSKANGRLNSTVPAAQQSTGFAGAGVNINVHPAPGMNESELARMVGIEMARQMRRGT